MKHLVKFIYIYITRGLARYACFFFGEGRKCDKRTNTHRQVGRKRDERMNGQTHIGGWVENVMNGRTDERTGGKKGTDGQTDTRKVVF